jgi:hypothetical protein
VRARGILVALVLGLLLAASSAHAQTVSRTLTWTQLNDQIGTVNGYTFTVKLDAAAAVQVTPVCQSAGANVTCATPIVLTSGSHTITVTATNAGGSASGTLNYVPPAGPTTPTSVQITIQITVP